MFSLLVVCDPVKCLARFDVVISENLQVKFIISSIIIIIITCSTAEHIHENKFAMEINPQQVPISCFTKVVYLQESSVCLNSCLKKMSL